MRYFPLVMLMLSSPLFAQPYPAKVVRLLIPFSAGSGSDTIQGGANLDVVFLTDNASGYTLSSGCSQTSCTITSISDGSTKVLTGVEIVIFKDGRRDL